jgi:hypothetical protein
VRQPAAQSLGSGNAHSEVGVLVAEHSCSRTLATGLGSGDSAMAIAAAHKQRSDGLHIAIDPAQESTFASEGMRRLRGAGLLQRVRLITSPPELALPELLRDDTQLDLALIEGANEFEAAFLEFFYLDRMLVTGGIIALEGQQATVTALAQYVARARAYEPRSAPDSSLTVLRKLGHHRPGDMPFPGTWQQLGKVGNASIQEGGSAPAQAPAPDVSRGGSALLTPTSSRELYLARARTVELEAVTGQLRARLLEAELETAHELDELRDQLHAAEAAHQQAEYWLAQITSSPSWHLTKPLRLLKKSARRLSGR